ncbi:ABC transporter permease [Enterococcus lemanii]|uniref:ABC transporter permease n=1 Tax=Enterococcus lemanii TaxID=1159752 RepID=A0ABV9MRQ6_9ENTE|nr:ABC transporter permease [Enterococcus lemanii]MBM7710275.1 osmoprotectant transport system permease protein [Enterococcus lemanii]
MLQEIMTYFQNNSSQYLNYLLTHLAISFKALFWASLIGLPLGYISYRIRLLAEFFQMSAQLLRIIPSLAVLFLLIPLVGVGEFPALIALTFLAVPSILINTTLGFQEVPVVMKEVASGLGMNPTQLFYKIEIPLAMPYILNGLKLALVEILASATLATYIGAGGLGTLIFTGLGLYRVDLLLIGGATVTLLSLFSIALFDFIIRKVRKNHV